ncbi:MAG: glycosyl hydrolase family 28-related protein [Verrucomicrobiota bacterium]
MLSSARAELIPAVRLIDWTPGVATGVPGGIPDDRTRVVDVTRAPYNADKTGNTDASSAISAAISAATAGDVIYLPAGTYLCRNPIVVGYKNGISIRGSGDSTVLKSTVGGSSFIQIGGGSDYNWSWPNSGNTITGGLHKGSRQITIGDTSEFRVGQIVNIALDNNPATPVVSVFGYQGLQRQMTRVTGKSGNKLEIFPGLYGDYSATRAVIHVAQFQANFVGLEHMLIDMSGSTAPFSVWLQQAYGCWVKNVHVKKSANYHIFLNDSLNCEVRQCHLDELNHVGTNGAGILCNTISGCLIEDNIIYKAFPLIEVNHGSSGNVFAYNFCEDSSPGVAIDSNHGPHNAYNLYEGNIAPNLQSDGYFGSTSQDTLFRNWFHGILNGRMGWTLSLNRFTRDYSIIGNIFQKAGYSLNGDGVSMGNPNMGNSSFVGNGPPWTDSLRIGIGMLSQSGSTVTVSSPIFTAAHVGWFIMTPTNSVLAAITAYKDPQTVTVNNSKELSGIPYILTPGPGGYQALDDGVASSAIRKGNYYYYGNKIPASESLGGEPLPASLFRTSKPAYFEGLAWPPFDPSNPNPRNESIPAGYRYATGAAPAPGSGTNPPPDVQQKPINVRISNE